VQNANAKITLVLLFCCAHNGGSVLLAFNMTLLYLDGFSILRLGFSVFWRFNFIVYTECRSKKDQRSCNKYVCVPGLQIQTKRLVLMSILLLMMYLSR
jgi:hypothetical protein